MSTGNAGLKLAEINSALGVGANVAAPTKRVSRGIAPLAMTATLEIASCSYQ